MLSVTGGQGLWGSFLESGRDPFDLGEGFLVKGGDLGEDALIAYGLATWPLRIQWTLTAWAIAYS